MKKDKKPVESVENRSVNEESNFDKDENQIVKKEFDASALTEEQAKKMLSGLIAENEDLKKDLEAVNAELNTTRSDADKFKDNWYRAVAEYENYKKRMADVRKTSYEDGVKDAVNNLLSIGDSVDRALSIELDEKTKAGVELILRQFNESLSAISVTVIDPLGKAFDPNNSEAIATKPVENDEDDGKVVQVYKKGYDLRGKILRYAQVVVGKKQ